MNIAKSFAFDIGIETTLTKKRGSLIKDNMMMMMIMIMIMIMMRKYKHQKNLLESIIF